MGIENLTSKPITKTIMGEEIKINPLPVEEAAVLMEMKDESKMMDFMLKKTDDILASNYPTSTKEERSTISMACFIDFVQGIMEAMGLDEKKMAEIKQKFGNSGGFPATKE